jgi:hypothetical protein
VFVDPPAFLLFPLLLLLPVLPAPFPLLESVGDESDPVVVFICGPFQVVAGNAGMEPVPPSAVTVV